MGFRFSRRIGRTRGTHINLGKRSGSLSIGGKGIHFSIGTRGTRTTLGIPGTGLYYTVTGGTSSSGRGAFGKSKTPSTISLPKTPTAIIFYRYVTRVRSLTEAMVDNLRSLEHVISGFQIASQTGASSSLRERLRLWDQHLLDLQEIYKDIRVPRTAEQVEQELLAAMLAHADGVAKFLAAVPQAGRGLDQVGIAGLAAGLEHFRTCDVHLNRLAELLDKTAQGIARGKGSRPGAKLRRQNT